MPTIRGEASGSRQSGGSRGQHSGTNDQSRSGGSSGNGQNGSGSGSGSGTKQNNFGSGSGNSRSTARTDVQRSSNSSGRNMRSGSDIAGDTDKVRAAEAEPISEENVRKAVAEKNRRVAQEQQARRQKEEEARENERFKAEREQLERREKYHRETEGSIFNPNNLSAPMISSRDIGRARNTRSVGFDPHQPATRSGDRR